MMPRWRRVRILTPGVTVLTLLVVSGCSTGPAEFAANGQQLLADAAADSTSSDGSPDLADFSAGQCLKDDTGNLEIDLVACDTPHLREITSTLMIGETYPGDDRVGIVAARACEQEFLDVTGITFDNSELELWSHSVSGPEWASADPQVVCSVTHPEEDLTDPVRVDPHVLRDPETGEVSAPIEAWWGKLRTGDCILESEHARSELETLVPCDTEHAEQVFSEIELPDGEFPGDGVILSAAEDECAGSLDTFVHSSIRLETIDYGYFYPTDRSWALGDREIQCRVMTTNGALITGSLDEAGTTISP